MQSCGSGVLYFHIMKKTIKQKSYQSNFNINKYFFILSLCFILYVPIGTLCHEYGHILVANFLGYNTILHYNSIDTIQKEEGFHSFLITLAGPLQTIITGSIGFLIIFFRRKKKTDSLNLYDWFYIFLSLFWLRQIFNLIISFLSELNSPNGSFFGGDEPWISEYLGLGKGFFSIFLGFIGLYVLFYIYFRIIPKNNRYTFIMSGFFGGSLGYFLWMKIIGPYILP